MGPNSLKVVYLDPLGIIPFLGLSGLPGRCYGFSAESSGSVWTSWLKEGACRALEMLGSRI